MANTSSPANCWMCCNKGNDGDEEAAPKGILGQVFERESLLNDGLFENKNESNKWSCCCKVCCSCFCLLLVCLLAAGVYVYHCVRGVKTQPSITLPLVKDEVGGQYFKLANMSHIPVEQWSAFEGDLMNTWETRNGYSFGYASVEDAPKLLYKASKTKGIFEQVPEKLRGVYWMRGNPLPEVLAVMHYAKWYEDEQILLLPNAPWTWAWWGAGKNDYPSGIDLVSKIVYSFTSGKDLAETYVDESALDTLVSFKFEPCPAGAVCEKGARELSYATLMSHSDGDLSKHNMAYYDGYTMEERDAKIVTDENQRPGANYFRRAEMFCGLFGSSSGYELVKILDGNGEPVEPFHADYLKFMADRPLIIWTGMPESKVPKE